nr:hypothetical protein [uncultured Allomuricauda sp.]
MGYRRGYYKKDGTYVQGHFVVKTVKRKKTKKGCLGYALAIVLVLMAISCENDSDCESSCSDFSFG